MIWLIIAIIAHLFYALVFIIDKHVLSRPLPHPKVYAFYIGVLSIMVWVIAPFGLTAISGFNIVLALLAGLAQVFGLICLYKALNKGDVSSVIPFVGSFVGLFTLIFSTTLIGESLSAQQLLAFIFLVVGSLIISIKKGHFGKAFGSAVLASLFFAFFWVVTKYMFLSLSFVSGIVWVRTAAALFSLGLLIPKKNRELIFKKTEKLKPKTIKYVFLARILSVFGAMGIYIAVFLGSVTLVNSMQGLQYIFVLILSFIFLKKIKKDAIPQKIISIILIFIGLALLVI
ncbi:EamA family transporter [Patescibacteria group bacterium]|nr:EamA family transporter [Patescibacteria group bacterium]